MQLTRIRIFNGNMLKIIAAICMVLDHIGFLWGGVTVLRMIGRISMPLFAFFIAEGCRYTKNKAKHFSLLFVLAVVCQVVYAFVDTKRIYLTILMTFSVSVILIYSLQYFKKCLFSEQSKWFETVLSGLLFAALVAVVYFINQIEYIDNKVFAIDYGFWGCLLPVFASLFDFRGIALSDKCKWLDEYYLKWFAFAVGVTLLCVFSYEHNSIVWYAYIALFLLLFYNGTRGKFQLKYFFYIFYPAHLVLLYGLSMII